MLGKKRNNQKNVNKSESFLLKLHDILKNNSYNNIIHWDTDGKRVIISDVVNLCNLVLPKFYKHHNYSSFVRQLNLYGFHKSKGISKCGDSYELEAFHSKATKEEINQIVKPTFYRIQIGDSAIHVKPDRFSHFGVPSFPFLLFSCILILPFSFRMHSTRM